VHFHFFVIRAPTRILFIRAVIGVILDSSCEGLDADHCVLWLSFPDRRVIDSREGQVKGRSSYEHVQMYCIGGLEPLSRPC